MRVFELYTRYDDLLELTADSEREYRRRFACKQCFGLSKEWRANPTPIDIELRRPPKGSIAAVADSGLCVLRTDLADALSAFLPGLMQGRVAFHKYTPPKSHPGWVTCFPDTGSDIDTYRGPYCRHVICVGGCGGIGNLIGWARGAVLRRDIGDKLAFFGQVATYIYVQDSVLEQAKLRERFPDLRPYEFPVVDEPLDGEVLPGDPEWDGVFRPAPPPEFPGDDDPWVER